MDTRSRDDGFLCLSTVLLFVKGVRIFACTGAIVMYDVLVHWGNPETNKEPER